MDIVSYHLKFGIPFCVGIYLWKVVPSRLDFKKKKVEIDGQIEMKRMELEMREDGIEWEGERKKKMDKE